MPTHNPATDWFSNARYGLFFHFLQGNYEEVSQAVKNFDATAFADSVARAGAAYVMFTITQNSGHLCVPSAVFDRFTEPHEKSAALGRDIVAEIIAALAPRNIRLMLYYPASGPKDHEKRARAMGCEKKPDGCVTADFEITDAFAKNWSEVMRELSLCYGSGVHGYWIDGCYAWSLWREEVAERYRAALTAGNPASIIAWNPGVGENKANSAFADYTAGEFDDLLGPVCAGRWLDGVQWHELSFLGKCWGQIDSPYTPEQVAAHINAVNANHGTVTLDVALDPLLSGCRIHPDALRQLVEINKLVTS